MKYLIYVKDQLNDLIGVYELKEQAQLTYPMQDIKGKVFCNGSKSNPNLKVISCLYSDLTKNKISLLQYKCLGKSKKEIFFLVKVKTINHQLILENFTQLNDSMTSYKNTIKKFSEYKKNIKKSKNQALGDAIMAQIRVRDYFIMAIEITLFVFSIVITLLKNPVDKSSSNCFEVLNSMSLLLLSIFVVLLQSTRNIIKKISKGLEFKKDCNLSTTIDGESKGEIINKVIDPKTYSKKYQDYQAITFGSNLPNEAFIYSDQQNMGLDARLASLPVKMEKYKQPLTDDSRKALAYIISEKLENDKTIFNGKLLGINSDLNFNLVNCVKIKQVRYHNYVATDEMIFKNVCVPTEPSKIVNGTKLTLNPLTHGLRDIENSFLTNLIGINLIVELNLHGDKYYVINVQSMYNDVNGSRFVPSASGSLDLRDYLRMNKKSVTFKELLKVGMFRELSEESYIFIDPIKQVNNLDLKIRNFTMLGFARLVSKAGKPDFFAKLEVEIDSVDDIRKILDNYDEYQTKSLGITDLETNRMIIISENDLFNNVLDDGNISHQLMFLIQLLRRKK